MTRLQQIQNSLAGAAVKTTLPSYAPCTGSKKWIHWIQAPFTNLQSSHSQPTVISAELHQCQASSQHSLFISGHTCSSIYIIFTMNNWPFFPICFTKSLESTFGFSLSILYQSLKFWHLLGSCFALSLHLPQSMHHSHHPPSFPA